MKAIQNHSGDIFSVDAIVTNGKGLRGKVTYVNEEFDSMDVMVYYDNGNLETPYKLHLDFEEIDDWQTIF
ncbi:MAG: hypothetical protein WC055_09955 [Melioribacteraceae bacterium]